MYDRKIRIGILLDDYQSDKWVKVMLDNIDKSGVAEISLVVKNEQKTSVSGSVFNKIQRHRAKALKIILHLGLSKIFNFLFDRYLVKNNAFEKINLHNTLDGIPVVNVIPKQKKFTDEFSLNSINEVKEYKVDLFIRLGFRILKGEILTLAPLGIWSYHHGDHRINRGGPNGFWEYVEKWPETGSILQILTQSLDGGKVLYQSNSCTLLNGLQENKSNNFWKSQLFIPRKLKELHNLGEKAFLEKVGIDNSFPIFYSKPIYVKPTNWQLTKIISRGVIDKFKKRIINFFYFEQWVLLYKVNLEMSVNMGAFKRVLPPKDRFWADPFIIEEEGKYFMFIEECPHDTHKGHLSVMTFDDNKWSLPTTIIKANHHLSYPNVFKINGEYFIIPESGDNKTIDLYQCIEFPYKWEHKKTLMNNITAYDATLVEHNNKWWLFCSVIEEEGMSGNDELHIFFSDAFDSIDWQPHKQNPVVSDVSLARPAGSFIKKNGRIYRPAQNSSNRYGYGFSFTEILELSIENYKEEVVTKVTPDWKNDVLSTHTYNHVNKISVSDAIINRPRFWG